MQAVNAARQQSAVSSFLVILSRFQVVPQRVHIHCDQHLAEERFILVRYIHLIHLLLQILVEAFFVGLGVVNGMIVAAVQLVECNVVVWEDAITRMNLLVNALAEGSIELSSRQSSQFVNPFVHRSSAVVVHVSFIPEDARLHIVQIVLSGLFELRIVAFHLELLSLQEIAGVIFIADGERHDIEFAQRFDDIRNVGAIAFSWESPHSQHLQHRFLCAVIRVLGASFTLGYPDVLLLLCDGIVNISAHELTGAEHLLGREAAPDGECLVHAHQPFDPRIDEQVVTDAYLYSCWVSCLHQFHIEQCRVEYDVAVVG